MSLKRAPKIYLVDPKGAKNHRDVQYCELYSINAFDMIQSEDNEELLIHQILTKIGRQELQGSYVDRKTGEKITAQINSGPRKRGRPRKTVIVEISDKYNGEEEAIDKKDTSVSDLSSSESSVFTLSDIASSQTSPEGEMDDKYEEQLTELTNAPIDQLAIIDSTEQAPRKRGRPKKVVDSSVVVYKEPRKRGRPRKSPVQEEAVDKIPKKRGRPKKIISGTQTSLGEESTIPGEPAQVKPRKRGRPRKDENVKKRGRPRKVINRNWIFEDSGEETIQGVTKRRNTKNSKKSIVDVSSIERLLNSSGDFYRKISDFKKQNLFLDSALFGFKMNEQQRMEKIRQIKEANKIQLKEKVVAYEA